MSASQSLRKGRKIRRRFSMSGHGASSASPKSLPSPTRDGHSRGTSMSPSRRSPQRIFQRLRYDSGSQTAVEFTERRGRSTSPVRIFTERKPPTAYASLPPTPILAIRHDPPSAAPSPTASEFQQQQQSPERDAEPETQTSHANQADLVPFSLWDYLREELLATDFDSHQELKWERVSNFLSMPLAMEKIIGFGQILCFDSFLYTFTILPIRFILALFPFFSNLLRPSAPPLPASQKADLLRALLLVLSLLLLSPLTDASKIYHTIRGQDTIKLYVIFNALEIGDRLCASIGQDILDCLFSRSTLEPLSRKVPISTPKFRAVFYFLLALGYNVAHGLVMVYQLISLNVAINSFDHALLTLLVSNQFVEIKGSVFKKFEKDSLFQITCADIVERFTLMLMLTVIGVRNLIEMIGTDFSDGGPVLPRSFGWFRGDNALWTISYPILTVMVSEMLVDWLKHAFITKFNHIRPSVYERYTDVLCRDLASTSAVGRRGARKHAYVDQSPLVARRLGFASQPLAVLFILVGGQSALLMFSSFDSALPWSWDVQKMSSSDLSRVGMWVVIGFLFWLCLLGIKVIIGVNLLSFAIRRRSGMDERAAADSVNDFGRPPIGEGKEEQKYNRELKGLLDNVDDDAPYTSEMGENQSGERGEKKRGRVKLEDLTRYTMVKRIW